LPRIGIDLGGTKIEGILLQDDRFCARRRIPTPAGDYRATLTAIGGLVSELETIAGQPCTVGVGTPGAPSPRTGRLRNANSTCLNDRAIYQDLSALLARPLRIANDADCIALSEATDGAAAGAHSVFGVILGTGTGGGIVINGRLLAGPNAIAGEWGHNPLPWPSDEERPGPRCYCGKRGCIETWLSGPGLARDYDADSPLTASDIFANASRGDAEAEACVQRYEDRLARALAGIINIIDPEVIVLGGGLSQARRLFDKVPARLPRYVLSDIIKTRIVAPMHGDSSGVRGAARLWPEG
jgi:fructokinase